MINLFLVLLIMYFAFFAYLMLAGAGLQRAIGILYRGVVQSVFAGLLFGVIPALVSMQSGIRTFLVAALLSSMVVLPMAALSRARDFILPRSSVLEVVCINVLVLTVDSLPHSFAFFDQFFGVALQLLLNPFAYVIPASLSWINFALAFWPSALALMLAAQARGGSTRLRFALIMWVQAIGILWLLPASIAALEGFAATSPLEWFEAFFGALGIVHVVLTSVTLRDALFRKRTKLIGEKSHDSTEKIGVARRLADSMDPGRWPPVTYVAVGATAYLLTRMLRAMLPDPQLAASLGFFAILAAGSLATKSAERLLTFTRFRALSWPVALVLLVAILFALQPANPMPQNEKVLARTSPDNRMPLDMLFRSVGQAAPSQCTLVGGEAPGLRCPDRLWPLPSLAHPAELEPPFSIDLAGAQNYQVSYQDHIAHCMEISARSREAEKSAVLVLIYVLGAAQGAQYGWAMEPNGKCTNIIAVHYRDMPESQPTLTYMWDAEVSKERRTYKSGSAAIPAYSGSEQR